MKKLTVIAAITISLTSNAVYATAGGKVRPPASRSTADLMTAGGKVRPPVSAVGLNTAGGKVRPPVALNTAGGKVRPPVNTVGLDTAGGKVRPPQSTDIIAQDSGTFSLSAIFSKYFSF